jgi:hypothetical protein
MRAGMVSYVLMRIIRDSSDGCVARLADLGGTLAMGLMGLRSRRSPPR